MGQMNAWNTYNESDLRKLELLNKNYRNYLDIGKTERECVVEVVRMAKAAGYRDLNDIIRNQETLKIGDKIYSICMDKAIALYHIGQEPIEKGLNILGAHVDAPRIDVKQIPLFEEGGYAYLDTHYYGGIKKYQWLAIPLALHGVVVKKDGSKIEIVIGEKEEDPVFVITDILPHLGKDQMDGKASQIIDGEKLNLLIGSIPLGGQEKNSVKAQISQLLLDTYGIKEEDFISAELEIVPAGKAKDCGMDRSMIIGYGQDDRVCVYTSVAATLEMEEVKRTSCCLLVDKEEVGSAGATGMKSKFFENSLAELMDRMGQYSELKLRRALKNSCMLSSDVSAAYDPSYDKYFEKKNSAYFGKGLVFNKYTGSRGKNSSNDANPEFIAHLRNIMEHHKVLYQTAELGAVDVGGGGTIAYLLAEYGMEVIDSGVPVLCMHAPWEITSKADIYEAVKGYKAFLKDA